jgi:TIR domain
MRIFLSYATEDKAIAEPIAFSLRARDHEVFLDRDDLPAAGDYNKRIELALDQADFMVFLLSPTSIAKGRYTLTELEFARRKWRTADGRVLPVIVQPTPLNDIPSFLKSVTILEPKGNTAAEVASAVDRVQPISRGAARANAGLEFIATYCTIAFERCHFLFSHFLYRSDATNKTCLSSLCDEYIGGVSRYTPSNAGGETQTTTRFDAGCDDVILGAVLRTHFSYSDFLIRISRRSRICLH